MKSFALGLLGIVLIHGTAAAQTVQEQDRILREFHDNVATLAAATPCPHIFTLPVATVFRQMIARTLEPAQVTHMAGVGARRRLDRHPAVREPFPAAELHEFPARLARALPSLPPSLEYRLIGNDLVLRDIPGDVIVAVLRDAIGRVTTARQ